MSLAFLPTARALQDDLDRARRQGSLREIVVPPCPDLLLQLREAMAGPTPDLPRIARIATSDVAMSATLIRHANAALNAVGPPVRTVGQAMDRIGLDAAARLMTAFIARNAIVADRRHLAGYWDQSSLRASAMGCIARHLPGLSEDLAYTCGLFLHVGLPVMLQSVRGYAGTLVEAPLRKDRGFVATENANHRTDHAVVGALVARVWQLAPPVMAAIRLHHDAEALADSRVEPEVRTLLAALPVAEVMMRRHEALPPDAESERLLPAALAWLHAGADDLREWQEELAGLMAEA